MSKRRRKKGRKHQFVPKKKYSDSEKAGFAKKLREAPTKGEAALWSVLENHEEMCVSQHVIRGFIVDFFFPEWNLVVEVDGGVHLNPIQVHKDKIRDSILRSCGYEILRFTNYEAIDKTSLVLQKINEEISAQKKRILSVRRSW